MKIAVVGVGAVGGYFGARLADSGFDVTFVARGQTLDSLRSEGLFVRSFKGDIHLSRIKLSGDFADVGQVDFVVLGVKAWQVLDTAELVRPLIGPAAAVLPLQNGVEAATQLASVLGPEHVLGGMCRIAAHKSAPNRVEHDDVEPFIALGEWDNRKSERASRLVDVLRRSGIEAGIPQDIRSAVWQKFLFIAPVSGMSAVTRSPLGILREIPETRALIERAMDEVHRVALGKGIALPPDIVRRTLDFLDKMDRDTVPSMGRDILSGNPSELESQNGAVVRLGRELSIDTPVNRFIYASLLPLEIKARSRR